MIQLPDIGKLTDAGLLKAGKLLIAHPLLSDSTFSRSVVFLCEHGVEGTIGFVLNQPTNVNIGDLLPEVSTEIHVNHGGPVQLDTLHILHRLPASIGGIEIQNGVCWGGSFDILQDMALTHSDLYNDIRLFVGYSGWSPGQLERELLEGSWLIGNVSQQVVFNTHPGDVWKVAIESLGSQYRYLLNMPKDPLLN